MKSFREYDKENKSSKYPLLMIKNDDSIIIMAYGQTEDEIHIDGLIIWSKSEEDDQIGDYYTYMKKENFRPYHGTITLSSD